MYLELPDVDFADLGVVPEDGGDDGADNEDASQAVEAEAELCTDDDIQLVSGSVVHRDFSEILTRLGLDMTHTHVASGNTVWRFTRTCDNSTVGRIYELTSATYKAQCLLGHDTHDEEHRAVKCSCF